MGIATKIFRADARASDRTAVDIDATVRDPRATPIDATILDLSTDGLRGEAADTLAVGDHITVGLPGLRMVPARIVRQSGREFACEFLAPIDAADVARTQVTDTLVSAPFAQFPSESVPGQFENLPEPDVQRWSGRVRLALLAVLLGTSWLLIYAAVRHFTL